MIIVTGLSGAGKTVALHTLEDLGYYCIDNLPCSLLPKLYEEQLKINMPVAVGIDIRNQLDTPEQMAKSIEAFKQKIPSTKILFLTAQKETITKRFSETRRKHPLASPQLTLQETIALERQILAPLTICADFKIDTSKLSIYELKESIQHWLGHDNNKTAITIESFGFKNALPIDADLVFDVRFLPNPHWEQNLRQYTGLDDEIKNYLGNFDEVNQFISDTASYLKKWLPMYLSSHRSYLKIAIGCTGGKHRSVYVTESIAEDLSKAFGQINVRHRDLPKYSQTKK